jgi:hypothetical protein
MSHPVNIDGSFVDDFVLASDYVALEQKLTDMAVHLANAESKCRELAVENAALKATCDDRRTFIMNGVQLGYIKVPTVDTDPALETIRIAVSPQAPTPATDAFLDEVRYQARTDFIGRIEWIIRNECNPDKTEEIINEMQNFSEELKLEAAQ